MSDHVQPSWRCQLLHWPRHLIVPTRHKSHINERGEIETATLDATHWYTCCPKCQRMWYKESYKLMGIRGFWFGLRVFIIAQLAFWVFNYLLYLARGIGS